MHKFSWDAVHICEVWNDANCQIFGASRRRRAALGWKQLALCFRSPFTRGGQMSNFKFAVITSSAYIWWFPAVITSAGYIVATNSWQTRDKLATNSRQNRDNRYLKKKTDLNLDFSRKSHASNHFSTRCMMDYHGLKSLNNFQHLIFTVSEALKSTANNGRPPVQNSPKVVVLNLDFSIKNSIKKQISTWLLIPIRTCLGGMLWHRGRTK